MKRKCVWYINKYFAPKTDSTPGGRDWNLLKEFGAIGYQVVVLASDSNSVWDTRALSRSVVLEHQEGLSIVWLRTFKYEIAKSFRRVLSWFHFEFNVLFLDKRDLPRPDVVVASSLSLLSVLSGVFLSWRYGCKFIFEVRDIWPLTIVEENGFSKRNPLVWLLSLVERFGYKRADAIIGTMPNLVEHVRSVSSTFAPVYCIPMGVSDASLAPIEHAELPFSVGLFPDNKFKIIYAGTIGITNALDVFFEAAEKLKERSDIHFFVMGEGPLRGAFESRYRHLDNVSFLPRVGRYQVSAVLSLCDVVYFSTFPSKVWDYGQSLNKVIDYMLSGKLTIASYSGHPSMLDEAGCGLFVPAGDVGSLVEVIKEIAAKDKATIVEVGARGREWLINNRRYSKLAKDFEAILLDIGV
ncbi:glycosyltransferase family 4 protein [Metapseudomonas otitidis]|uniref:glycosyltransferase family 4 protein n=1 Tax=Metapseudomonas otitidis TaxID=319939 RepID=UPI0013F5D38D|nr:glycosyltransferase family 4 protein [Pseudomonas otitidis]